MFSLALNFLPSASIAGENFDLFMKVAVTLGVVLFVGTLGTAFYFCFRYRRRKEGEETAYIPGNYLIEFASVFGIAIWVSVFFIWGWRNYSFMIAPKMNEYEINIIGQQWNWQIQYDDGRTFTNELFVPRGVPIKLVMTSKDVVHSFFLPEMRMKEDVVPGQFTSLHFTAVKAGDFHIFCAEYCGTSHSRMIGTIHVLEPDDFQRWKDGLYNPPNMGPNAANVVLTAAGHKMSMAEQGKAVYQNKSCNACHSVHGEALVGPTFKGLFGSQVLLEDGSKVTADENYIRESMMDPMKKIVKGFSPTMPTFRGMLSDQEVNELVAYIKSLK